MGAVDECLGEVELAPLLKVASEREQNLIEHAFALPLLKTPMASLIRRIAPRQIRPRRARSQNPEYAVQHVARIAPRTATLRAGSLALWAGDVSADRCPLLVGEIH